jgi:hypothetical protein
MGGKSESAAHAAAAIAPFTGVVGKHESGGGTRIVADTRWDTSITCGVGGRPRHNWRVKHWELIADNLSKAGWSWGCVSAIDSSGRTIWIVDVHRDNGKRFVARADEKLSAFLELESAIRAAERLEDCGGREIKLDICRVKPYIKS